ncbi:MAG: STAS domain-containing protein [Phycisphaerae bacterium]
MAGESANQLEMEVQRLSTATVVRMRGSAGMREADYLRDQLELLAESAVRTIVLDLAELEFISSAGLGAILSARAKARPHGGEIRLINPRPFVLRILETTRLDHLFAILPSLQDALDA